MIKRMLKYLLNKQLKIWEKELETANLEYDWICLTDTQLKEVIDIKDKNPEKIKIIKKLLIEI